ncbi:unnamed protein product [Bursaphelenchus okinawaensis]|uniref:Intramembrane protease n=1 Tax=Bursaphelenchus okinawaensis TaxID=465554 RepID=A0A811KVT8_9BILA|nr:unnamed protein product [Bursaphelenchus okinawaensis]CAG9112528.1 unnamed protein product [Bursaphelenchus okinawaensis]
MAETATTTATPEKVVFTFEEQVLSSCSLYSMALLCVVWGSIRSVKLIKTHVAKKRNIESSIGWKEATRFPLTASFVLFGLYVVFKGPYPVADVLAQKVQPYVPEEYFVYVESGRDYFLVKNNTDEAPVRFQFVKDYYYKIKSSDPRLEDFVNDATTYIEPYVPEVNKSKLAYWLLVLLVYEGCSALAVLFKPVVSFVLRLLPIGDRWPKKNTTYLWSIKKGKKEMEEGDIVYASHNETESLVHIEYDCHYLGTLLLTGIFVGVSHLYRRHWITNNLLGIGFSVYGIENLHLASFKAGLFLLIGLFFYDIFWVFGTDVMTTVAKSIDAPILLQFPQDILRVGWFEASKYSMLGLGDIVVPGIFVALLYRFDHYVGSKKTEKSKNRYYFAAVIVGYMVGLLVTMGVMHHFKAAQPALLYLVPSCIIIPLILAVIRGEFSELWNYTEEHIVNPEEAKEKEAAKKSQKKKDKKSE